MSSNEVLAARLVLDTLDGLPGMCREGFREFSERAGTSACLAPILQNIYGAQLLCSLEDADFHSSLRAIMFGGTFRQVCSGRSPTNGPGVTRADAIPPLPPPLSGRSSAWHAFCSSW